MPWIKKIEIQRPKNLVFKIGTKILIFKIEELKLHKLIFKQKTINLSCDFYKIFILTQIIFNLI
jgi:hypothetical protein